MKNKRSFKKLSLNKKTVADLSGESMTKVKGGCNETDCRSCNTNFLLCSIEACPFPTSKIVLLTLDC